MNKTNDKNFFFVNFFTVSVDEAALGAIVELTQSRVLEIIESSYPNAVTLEDIVK